MNLADHDQHSGQLTRIVLRPLGNPLPLGFLGLAGATITLTGQQLHWVPDALSQQVGIVLIFFAAPAQLIASVLGFLSRDAPTGAAMGVLAGTWLTTGVILFTSPPGSHSPVLGLFLFVAAAAMMISAISAGLTKLVPALVLTTTALRFATSGVYEYTSAGVWGAVSGWVGLALCVLALYAALAIDLDDVAHQPVLPMPRHGRGKQASIGIDGDLQREPGVREQL